MEHKQQINQNRIIPLNRGNFIPWRGEHTEPVGECYASISAQGHIYLAADVIREDKLEKFEHVRLQFEPYEKWITINFTTQSSPGKINLTRNASSFIFSARGFFKHFGIPFEKLSGRYPLIRYRSYANGDKTYLLKLPKNTKSIIPKNLEN